MNVSERPFCLRVYKSREPSQYSISSNTAVTIKDTSNSGGNQFLKYSRATPKGDASTHHSSLRNGQPPPVAPRCPGGVHGNYFDKKKTEIKITAPTKEL